MSSTCSSWDYEVNEDVPMSLTTRYLKNILETKACEMTIGGIIVLNMVMIILETDANASNQKTAAWIAGSNYALLVFYNAELLTKIFVYRMRFFSDGWNLMDLLVVGSDVVLTCLDLVYKDMPKFAPLRAARLVRLARVFKAASSFPELAMILRGFVRAFKAMIWGVVLILLMLTIWSILAVQLIHPLNKIIADRGIYDECYRCPFAFETVFMSTLTLFQTVVAGDSWGTVALPIIEAYPVSGLFFLAVLVSVSLAIMNLILAVILESAQDALCEANLDQVIKEDKEYEDARQQFLALFNSMDTEQSGMLSKAAMMRGFEDAKVRGTIRQLNLKRIDIENLLEAAIDPDAGVVDYAEFVSFFTNLRAPSNHTMLLEFSKMNHRMERQLQQVGQDVVDIPSRMRIHPLPQANQTAKKDTAAGCALEEDPVIPLEKQTLLAAIVPVVEAPNLKQGKDRELSKVNCIEGSGSNQPSLMDSETSVGMTDVVQILATKQSIDQCGLSQCFPCHRPAEQSQEAIPDPSANFTDTVAPYELWPSWTHGKASGSITGIDLIFDPEDDLADDCEDSEEELGAEAPKESEIQHWWVANPNSKRRMQWDLFGIVVLTYDIIMIPFIFCFEPTETPGWWMFNFMVLIFWTADVLASFCVGYVDKSGVLVMNGYMVGLKYIKTWCLLDCLIVGVDWLMIALNGRRTGASSVMRIGKLLRAARILRTLRLVRLVKFKHMLSQIQDRIDSEFLTIGLGVVKLILIIFVINHFIACLWFKLGSAATPPTGQYNWVRYYRFHNASLYYQYMSSLHWSLTQFTPASNSVQPVNTYESAFAVLVLLFAMIVFSSFVSSITAAMNQLRNLSAKNGSQMWMLRKYLREQGVPPDLYMRLIRYVSVTAERMTKKVQRNDVKFLALLSTPLTMELTAALFRPHVIEHPFYERLGRRCKGMMHKLCTLAIKAMSFSRGDVLFAAGEAAIGMYFLTQGTMWYNFVGRPERAMLANKSGSEPMQIKTGTWFSEAVLWTPWQHCGKMRAGRESDVILVEANKFRDLALLHPAQVSWIRHHGEEFVRRLNSHADKASDVLDWTVGSRSSGQSDGLLSLRSSDFTDIASAEAKSETGVRAASSSIISAHSHI